MEKIVEQTLLYDFYGELLTSHQQQVYEDVVLNDYSLSEVAEEMGISRQGVFDLIKRCNKLLSDYEDKLHLVKKFLDTKEKAAKIRMLTHEYIQSGNMKLIYEIEEISSEIEDL
ncbi:MAG: DNA-binding protein [Lachnospiraceae bacterium]|nr:DNA-binding protein [Lachnospiraceae bacterium]